MIALRNETEVHTFLPSFDNANGHLYHIDVSNLLSTNLSPVSVF